MLAALAGFDNKTDKYVMQRLLRAGDINCKNREVMYLLLFPLHYLLLAIVFAIL